MSSLRSSVQAGVLGVALVGGLTPTGACLIPDYCIRIEVPGRDICKVFWNAEGIDANGDTVSPLVHEDFRVIMGCICLTDAEVEILTLGDEQSLDYQLLELQLDFEVRATCLEVASQQDLVEHNCTSAESVEDEPFEGGAGACSNRCVYTNPPPFGTCPPDSACRLGDEETGETAGSEGSSQTEDTGTEADTGLPQRGVSE